MVGDGKKLNTLALAAACGIGILMPGFASCARPTDEPATVADRRPDVAQKPPSLGAAPDPQTPRSARATASRDRRDEPKSVPAAPEPDLRDSTVEQETPRPEVRDKPPARNENGRSPQGPRDKPAPGDATGSSPPPPASADPAVELKTPLPTTVPERGAVTTPTVVSPNAIETAQPAAQASSADPANAKTSPAGEFPESSSVSPAPPPKTTPQVSRSEPSPASAQSPPAPSQPVQLPKSRRQTECAALHADFQRELPGWLARLDKEKRLDSQAFWAVFSEWLDGQQHYSAETRQQVATAIRTGLGLMPGK
jgi:hypothetical protein